MNNPPTRAHRLIHHVASSSLGNLALPLSALVTGPLLARALAPEGRGLMAALLAPISLANLMFTLGMPESMIYHVAKGRLSGRSALKIGLAGGLICGVIACAAMLLASPYLLRAQPQYLPVIRLLLLTLPVSLVFAALRGIVQARQGFATIRNERLAGVFLRLLLLTAFVMGGLLTPINATWISVLSGILGSLLLIPALRRPLQERSASASLTQVARYAGAVAVGTLSGLLILRLDQVLMISLTTHAELGYYAVAASLAEVPLTVVVAIRDVVFTLATEQEDPHLVARLCRITLLSIATVCLVAALLTPVLVPLLFGHQFMPSVRMVEILLVGTVASAVTAVIGAGLMSAGKAWVRSVIQLGGATLTAVLLFLFVPRGGGLAASWVTAFTYAALAFASVVFFSRLSGLSIRECLVPTRADLAQTLLQLKPRIPGITSRQTHYSVASGADSK
jgi:O-antigen/teichoic acid export membrane protein